MPDWIVPACLVGVFLLLWIGVARRNTAKQIAATLARRPNPSRDQFRQMLAGEISPEASDFLWKTALPYVRPRLTPHPEDDLGRDLPIDSDDWSMDWPRDFAREQGFDPAAYPAWPEGWPATVRNFGRWLDSGASLAVAKSSDAGSEPASSEPA